MANADTAQLFDRELPGLAFQLKERPWYEHRNVLVQDLCRGRLVASDSGLGDTHDVSDFLGQMRLPLSTIECERLRALGQQVAHAVEATGRNFAPGATEADVAGELSHRLIKHQIIPERIQVAANRRTARYRHWSCGNDRIDSIGTIAVVGRRFGLSAAASRTVSFGEPPTPFRAAYQRAALVQATGMHFSRADWELFEIWNRIRRIYEKYDFPEEWQHASQAEIIGYETCEVPIVPKSEYRLAPRTAVHWHPSVNGAALSDTILVGEEGYDVITPCEQWPRLKIKVKGQSIFRPDILQRDA